MNQDLKREVGGLPTWILLKWVISFVKPYWGWIFINIGASVISVSINLFSVYLIKEVIKSANNGQHNILGEMIAFLICIIAIGILAKYFAKFSAGRFSNFVIHELKNSISQRLIKVRIDRVEEYQSGDIISSIANDMTTLQKFLENDFVNCIYYPLMIIAAFCYMLQISWQLLLVCFFVTPITMIVTNILSKPISKLSKEYHQNLGEYNSLVDEMVKGITTFKAFNLLKLFRQKCQTVCSQILKTSLRIELYNSLMLPGTIIMYEFPFILCIIFGGFLSIKGMITPVSLIAFLQLLTFLIYPTTFLPKLLANSKFAMGAVERLYEFFHLQLEKKCQKRVQSKVALNELAIEFLDGSFRYQNSEEVLDGINFQIPQGQTVALVGVSGSGKSSVVNLICGFYQIHSGSLKIFGQEINEWEISELRSLISLVSQDSFLFPGSIARNISYGKLGASEIEIINAAKAAGSHEFIMKLPKGYETLVGEKGVKLSGGERQRISLARAVLKNAPILLLDEPTSALDSQSEALFQQALLSLNNRQTVLVIAHRLATIKRADQILVLDRGKIVEQGTHSELIRLNGVYLNLYQKQFANPKLEILGGA